MDPRSRTRWSRLVCFAIIALALSSVFATSAYASTWSGTVRNEAGDALTGIEVRLDFLSDADLWEWVMLDQDTTDAAGHYSVSGAGWLAFNEFLLTFHDPKGLYEDRVAAVADESDWHSYTCDVVLEEAGTGPDTTPPVTTDNAPSGWVKLPADANMALRVTLTATDDRSGVVGTWYQVNQSGLWHMGTTLDFLLALDHRGDGIYRIDYFSADAAGNTETTKTCYVRIDTTEPAASLPGPTVITGSIELSALDDLSPTCTVEVQLLRAGGKKRASLGRDRLVARFAVEIPADGTVHDVALPDGIEPGFYRVYATATDLAGNVQSVPASTLVRFRP